MNPWLAKAAVFTLCGFSGRRNYRPMEVEVAGRPPKSLRGSARSIFGGQVCKPDSVQPRKHKSLALGHFAINSFYLKRLCLVCYFRRSLASLHGALQTGR